MDYKFCPKCGNNLGIIEIEGKERWTCQSEACDYVFWDNPTPVIAAIVELDGDVILARNKAWPEKIFGLVTGFLEKEETPEEGILREVKEELGLEGKVESFVGYYSFYRNNQLILAFHIKAQGKIVLGEELAETKAVKPEKLRPWPFGTGHAVQDWLDMRKEKSTDAILHSP